MHSGTESTVNRRTGGGWLFVARMECLGLARGKLAGENRIGSFDKFHGRTELKPRKLSCWVDGWMRYTDLLDRGPSQEQSL